MDTSYSLATELTSHDNDGADFEIAFGRRQLASTGLVLIVVLACFSGVSYLIGRSGGTRISDVATAPSTALLIPAAPAPAKKAAEVPALTMLPEASNPKAPVFGVALAGNVYIQVGAIEKELAGIWAEGLRTHGLDAFVATGLNDNEWRVLVGPLPDPQSYQRAKDTLDNLGITTFGRRYISSDSPDAVPAAHLATPPATP
jgi:hypothetical protein